MWAALSGHFRFSGPLNMHASLHDEKVEGRRMGADDDVPAYFGVARELLFGPKSALIALLPPEAPLTKKGDRSLSRDA